MYKFWVEIAKLIFLMKNQKLTPNESMECFI